MSKLTDSSSSASTLEPVRKLSILQTVRHILATDGPLGFMRGIGPALVLVINPVIQYTVFEQLKNVLVTRRTTALRAAGGVAAAAAVLTDLDFFFLGALSKFSEDSRTS
jgi:solute carrier family 25 (peroxisomal adenine nucleotide transporter), member 17